MKIATLPGHLQMVEVAWKKDEKKILMPFGHRFVTAARTANETLKLTVWDVNPDGNQMRKRGTGGTGEIHKRFEGPAPKVRPHSHLFVFGDQA